MSLAKETKLEMTRYLLGAAAPAEQAALEDRFAADAEVFEQLVAVENDLADRYARGQLAVAERAAFERHVLAHPQRRARAQFAAALVDEIDRAAPAEPVAWRQPVEAWWRAPNFSFSLSLGLAAAALALAFFGWQAWRESQRLRGEVEQLRAAGQNAAQRAQALQAQLAEQQQQNAQLNTELQRIREATPSAPAAPAFVSLLLSAGAVRDGAGGEMPRLILPGHIAEVRLRLKLVAQSYARYRLTLQAANGNTIRQVNLRAANPLSLNLPARLLNSGEYVLALSGLNAAGEADALSKTIFVVAKK